MGINYKMQGRAELTRRLERLVPGVTEAAAKAKLEVAQEAAAKIAAAAPGTGNYKSRIKGERQADNPNKGGTVKTRGHRESEDPDATGVYAPFFWRFLEFGTAPHSTALGGGTVLGKKKADPGKLHPGSRKFPHVYPTWRSMKPKAKRRIANAINKYIREDLRKK